MIFLPRYSLQLLLLVVTLIAGIVGWQVAVRDYHKHMRDIILQQNGNEIRQRQRWLEDAIKEGDKLSEEFTRWEIRELEAGRRRAGSSLVFPSGSRDGLSIF
jgi:hypothetical protein